MLLEIFADGETPYPGMCPSATISGRLVSPRTYAIAVLQAPTENVRAHFIRAPFAGMDNPLVISMILGGYRAPKPPRCPEDVYGVMLSCWHERPYERPSFKMLCNSFHKIVEDFLKKRSEDILEDGGAGMGPDGGATDSGQTGVAGSADAAPNSNETELAAVPGAARVAQGELQPDTTADSSGPRPRLTREASTASGKSKAHLGVYPVPVCSPVELFSRLLGSSYHSSWRAFSEIEPKDVSAFLKVASQRSKTRFIGHIPMHGDFARPVVKRISEEVVNHTDSASSAFGSERILDSGADFTSPSTASAALLDAPTYIVRKQRDSAGVALSAPLYALDGQELHKAWGPSPRIITRASVDWYPSAKARASLPAADPPVSRRPTNGGGDTSKSMIRPIRNMSSISTHEAFDDDIGPFQLIEPGMATHSQRGCVGRVSSSPARVSSPANEILQSPTAMNIHRTRKSSLGAVSRTPRLPFYHAATATTRAESDRYVQGDEEVRPGRAFPDLLQSEL